MSPIATDIVDGTVMAGVHAALHNEMAVAINAIDPKVGSGVSAPVANSLLAGTGAGTSAWSTAPTIAGLRSATTTNKIYFDNQGIFTENFLTDARVMVKRAETGVRTDPIYGMSFHGQVRGASDIGDRMIGVQSYIEDASAVNKTITNVVNNGAGLFRVTAVAHGGATGQQWIVDAAGGVPNANGLWTITKIDDDTVDLQGSTFAGTYTSGGVLTNRAGFYGFQSIVVPRVTRGFTSAANVTDDDIACYGAYNAGDEKVADAFYVAANPAIVGSAFGGCFSTQADCDIPFYADGAIAVAAIDISKITGAGVAIDLPQDKWVTAKKVAAGDANLFKLNSQDVIELGIGIRLGGAAWPAGSMQLRNDFPIVGRNAADLADVSLFRVNTANELQFDAPMRFNNQIVIGNTFNFTFSTSTGTKIGTATTQKFAFWNATPIVQPANTTDLRQAIINLGLLATGGATPLNLNGGALTAATGLMDTSIDIATTGFSAVDGTAWTSAGRRLRIASEMSAAGTGTPNSANEHAIVMQLRSNATASAAGYQKTALLMQAQQDDPSEPGIVRNVVPIDQRGIIGAANTDGRVWGGYSQAQILDGGDGTLFGYETVLLNYGTDVALPGAAKQKVGHNWVARGDQPSTVALNLASADSQYWHHGLYAPVAALGTGAADSFVELVGKFTVRPTGKTIINGASEIIASALLEVQQTATSDPLVAFGNASGAQSFSVQLRNSVGAGKWFMCGVSGAFLTATAAGDMGLIMPTAGKSIHIGGSTKVVTVTQDNKLGFFAVAPVVQPAAYTQTYATADRTHANPLATSVATTAATQTTPWGFSTQAQADAIVTAINNLILDVADVKQIANSLIDDHQAMGLCA